MRCDGRSCAFPVRVDGFSPSTEYGLSKREFFAATVMAGIVSKNPPSASYEYEWCAKASVKLSDALIAELSKEK